MDDLHSEDQQVIPQLEKRVISGFWRRILAFVIDGIFMGLVGFAVGIFFFDPLAHLGGWGRLLGFCAALVYYGVLNSSIGNGQTIGKRIVKIEVVNGNGEHISLGRSSLRYSILAVPFFLNAAMIPPALLTGPLGYLLGLLIFGLGGAIIYLYIFNRRTRQSLHDMVCDTFVVRTFPKGDVLAGPVWKTHIVIVSVWFILVAIGAIVMQNLSQKGIFPGLLATQQAIISSGKVHMATVFVGKTWTVSGSNKNEVTYVASNAVWKKRPANYETAAREVALIILNQYPGVMTKDVLEVTITYGYDIGIARAWHNWTFRHSPAKWKDVVSLPVENAGVRQ
ncbi:MAG: RDD family protein [Syntrophorhabdus sp. PtaU1.Bin058]|nr:MAG: RDD family protein [Syntrophorhabdus sp. PtaU1.Bin058]